MSHKVEFYYDFSSPYSYLASTRIEAICEKYGARLEWKPFLLGGVYKETGNRAPLEVPSKLQYMIKDLDDWAKYYGIELNFPELFPVNSVKSMRGALVAKKQGKIREYTRCVFKLYWVNGFDISQDEVLRNAVKDLGLDDEKFVNSIIEQDIKDKLRSETGEAVKRGAFGAPTIFLNEKMFWGNDRLDFVEEYLKTNS
ncbi:2-hydroxychromene-2-carboxylate isomerase [Desulfobacterota bacterium AH_259_B03_O07]|nr:2-hydroxychromene-2-carboxylate isomerase [Desulfobacterota bacterium AH_259_B03_O07]